VRIWPILPNNVNTVVTEQTELIRLLPVFFRFLFISISCSVTAI